MWFDIMFWTLKSLPQNMFWYPIMGDDYIRRRGNLRRRSSSSSSFKIFFRWLGTPFWGMYSSTCIHRPFWQSTTRAIKGQHPIWLPLLLLLFLLLLVPPFPLTPQPPSPNVLFLLLSPQFFPSRNFYQVEWLVRILCDQVS